MDNLWSHKSVYIMKVMQDKNTSLLFTPSNTPQFSPIVSFPYIFLYDLGKYVLCIEEKTKKHACYG
jgi:transposase